MKDNEVERIKTLLQQALPAVSQDAGPERDLWPAMLRRMDEKSPASRFSIWFDWALLAGIAGVAALFPQAIPLLLYYL